MALIAQPNFEVYKKAADILRNGFLVGMPTETVYGLAADAFNEEAVLRIFRSKRRPLFDPLIVHVTKEWAHLELLASRGIIDIRGFHSDEVRNLVQGILTRLTPGPLTILMPRGPKIPDLVTSGLPLVGIRFPQHQIFQDVLKLLQAPIAAPSANSFGRISPTTAEHVNTELGDCKDLQLILDGGPCQFGIESTIIEIKSNPLRCDVYRPGGLGLETLRQTFASMNMGHVPVEILKLAHLQKPVSPGLMANHYAPSKPMFMFEGNLDSPKEWSAFLTEIISFVHSFGIGKKIGVLVFGEEYVSKLNAYPGEEKLNIFVLPFDNTGDQAARGLFKTIRNMDVSDSQLLVVIKPKETGFLWSGILDRLQRACVKIC